MARMKKPLQSAMVLSAKSEDAFAAVMKSVDIGVSKSPAGNSVRVRVPPAAPIEEERREVLSYIIGVALGDGNLSRPNGRATRLRISCDKKYQEMAADMEAALHILFPKNKVSRVIRVDEESFDISVYSNDLNCFMPWVVGMGTKIEQKVRVPEWIRVNKSYMEHCLRGLIQTDGCIYTDRGYQMINFTSSGRELAEDVYMMLSELGYRPTVHKVSFRNTWLDRYNIRVARKEKAALLIKNLKLYKS